jgi:hypothetical protein
VNYREQRKQAKKAAVHVAAAISCLDLMDREPSVVTLDTVLQSTHRKLTSYAADLSTRLNQSERLKRQQKKVTA